MPEVWVHRGRLRISYSDSVLTRSFEGGAALPEPRNRYSSSKTELLMQRETSQIRTGRLIWGTERGRRRAKLKSQLRKILRTEQLEPRMMLFNPYTHIEIASDVRDAVIDDGHVTVEGENYPVHPRIVEALERFPSHFYGGSVGPDGYPDLIMGQQVVHTESINIWASHVLDKAWEIQDDSEFGTREYSETEQLQVLAWSYGFVSHAIGDMWVHTFVDEVADGPFPGLARALMPTNALSRGNALRHIIIESYIADATPGFDGVGADETGETREQLPDGDVSSNASLTRELNAPHRFIHDALVYDLPHMVAQEEETLFRLEDPKDTDLILSELNDLSYVGIFITREMARANVHFTGDLRRTGVVDADSDGAADTWTLQADYRDFVVRREADGSLAISETLMSRGLILDQFLTMRQRLVDLKAPLPPVSEGIAQPLEDLVQDTEEALLNLVSGDGFDFAKTVGDIVVIADALVDPFREVLSDVANDRPVTDMALLDMASSLGGLVGGTAAGYLQYWIDNIDEGLENWSIAGQSLARSMFDPQARREVQNNQGETAGADAVGPLMPNDRADAEESDSLFRTLIAQLEDPNSDNDQTDSFINNYLLSMLGMPDAVGRIKGLLQEFINQIESDLLDPLDQLPTDINPLAPALDLLKDKVKDFAVDIIKRMIEERFGVDIDTISVLLGDGSGRLDMRSVTLALPDGDDGPTDPLVTQIFKPTDHELIDRALGFFGKEHLVPLEHGGGELLEPFGEVLSVEMYEDAHGRLKDSAEFNKETFAPYTNSVTMTELLLLQEWDPMRIERSFDPFEEPSINNADHPRTLSHLLSDLTGESYDFSLLNNFGQHGGSLFTATLPGVRDEFGMLVADSTQYRQPFDHDVWFRSMDGNTMWRSDSASRFADLFRFKPTNTGAIGEAFQAPDVPGYVEYKIDRLVPGENYALQTDWILNNQLHLFGEFSPAAAARYEIRDGDTVLEAVTIDQMSMPGDRRPDRIDEIVIPTEAHESFEAYGQSWRQLAEVTAPAAADGAEFSELTVRLWDNDAEGDFVVAGRLRAVGDSGARVFSNRDIQYSESESVVMTLGTSDVGYVSALQRMTHLGALPETLLADLRARGQFFGDEYYQALDPAAPEDVFSQYFHSDSQRQRGYLLKELSRSDDRLLFELVRLRNGDADTNGLTELAERYHLQITFSGPMGAQTANVLLTQPWRDIHYLTGAGNWALWESELLRDNVFRKLFFDWQNGDVIGNWISGERQGPPKTVEVRMADLSGIVPEVELGEVPAGRNATEILSNLQIETSEGRGIDPSGLIPGTRRIQLPAGSITPDDLPLSITYLLENNFPQFDDNSSPDPNDGTAVIESTPFEAYKPHLPVVTSFGKTDGEVIIVSGNQTIVFEDDVEIDRVLGDDAGGFDDVTIDVAGTLTLNGFIGDLGLRNIRLIAEEIVIAEGATISSRQLVAGQFDHLSSPERAASGDIVLDAERITIGKRANILAHAFDAEPGDVTLSTASRERDSANHIVAALLDNLVGSGLQYEEAVSAIDVGNDSIIRGATVSLGAKSTINRSLTLEEVPFSFKTTATLLENLDSDPEPEWIVATSGQGLYVYDFDPSEGYFTSGVKFETGEMQFTSLAAVDLDLDGDLDLVAGSGDTLDRVYTNAAGTLSFSHTLGTEVRRTTALAAAPGSGSDVRVIVGTADAGLFYYDLIGAVEVPIDTATPMRITDLAVGNISGSGNGDIVVGNLSGPDRIYLSSGLTYSGSDLPAPGDASTLATTAIALGNLDADTELELLVATDEQGLYLYQGSATGFLTFAQIDDGPFRTQDIAVADLNDDGRQDFLLANEHQQDRFYLANADGSFEARKLHSDSPASTTINAGDLNLDGRPDAILGVDRSPNRFYFQDEFEGEMLFPVDTYIGVDRSVIGDATTPLPVSVPSAEEGVEVTSLLSAEEAMVVSADASATILVGEGVWIEAGNNVNLATQAEATARVRTSESAFGITFARARPLSTIKVLGGATIHAVGTVSIESGLQSELDVHTSVPSVGEKTGFSVSLGINDAESDVDVRSGVRVRGKSFSATATSESSFSNTATASSFGTAEDSNTVFAAVLATGFNQNTATVEVAGIIEVEQDFDVSAAAHMPKNITRSYGWVSGGSSVSDGEESEESPEDFDYSDLARQIVTLLPLTEDLEALAEGVTEGADMIAGYNSDTEFQFASSEFSSSTPGNQIAAAFALANSDNDAAASIGTEAIVRAGRGVSVTASAEDTFQVSASSTAGLFDPGDNLSLGGALAFSTTFNQSSAFLGWNASVDARGAIDVMATSKRKSPTSPLAIILAASGVGEGTQIAAIDAGQAYGTALIGERDKADEASAETNVRNAIGNGLDSIFGAAGDAVLEENEVGSSFVSSTGSTEGGVGLSFALNFLGTYNAAYAGIAEGARVNQNSDSLWPDGTSGQDVIVTAKADSDVVNIAGTNSALNIFQDESATTGGGVADVTLNQNIAIASISDRAQVVSERDVLVQAEGIIDSTLVALAGGQATKTAVEGALAFNHVQHTAQAIIEDRAQLRALGELNVLADTKSNVVTVTPGIAVGGGKAVGVGAAVNYLVDRSEAFVADRHNDVQGMCGVLDERPDCDQLAGGRGTYGGAEYLQIPAGGYWGDPSEMPTELPSGQHPLSEVVVGGDINLHASSAPRVWSVAIAGGVQTGDSGDSGGGSSGDGSGSGLSGPTSSLSVSDTEQNRGSSEGDGGLALAAAFSLNILRNYTGAYIDDSATLLAGGIVDIDATSDANVISVGGGLAVATEGGAGAGNYAHNHFLQYTKASVERAHVAAAELNVHATSLDRQLVIGPSAAVASDNAGAAGVAIATSRINTTAALGDDARLNANVIDVVANNHMNLIPIVGLIAIGGDGAYGANLAVTNVDTFVQAWVANSARIVDEGVGVANLRVIANNATELTTVAAAIAASGESAAAGSGTWVDLDLEVQALIDDSDKITEVLTGRTFGHSALLVLGNLYLDADDQTTARVIAGTLAVGGGDAGVGISLSHLSIDRTVKAEIGKAATVHATAMNDALLGPGGNPPSAFGSGITLDATANDLQWMFAAAGGISGGVGAAPSIVINRNDSKVHARIAQSARINTVDDNALAEDSQSVHLRAEHGSTIVDVAGAVGIGSDAGVGLALDLLFLNKDTRAEIDSSATVNAKADVRMQAGGMPEGPPSEDILSFVGGVGAASTAGVAASISVITVSPTTFAGVPTSIDAPAVMSAGIRSGGTIGIRASNALSARFISGSIGAGGTVGAGAANATLRHTAVTEAAIGVNAQVAAEGDISVEALQEQSIVSVGVALGAAGTAGVAGVAVVSLLDETTLAQVAAGASLTSHSGSLIVAAEDRTRIVTVAGSLGVGGTVGVAAGADVSTIDKYTQAAIDSGTQVRVDENVFVTANSEEDITSVAAGVAAAAVAAVALDASVHVLNIDTRAFVGDDPSDDIVGLSPTQIIAFGSIVIDADDRNEIDKVAGALAAAVTAGIAGAGGVSFINKNVESFVGESVTLYALGLRDAVLVSTGVHEIVYSDSDAVDLKMDTSIGIEASTHVDPTAYRSEELTESGEVPLPKLDNMDLDRDSGETPDNDLSEQALKKQRVSQVAREMQTGLIVTATQNDDIEVLTMSAGFGLVGVAISASANVIDNQVRAYIGDSAIVNQPPAIPPDLDPDPMAFPLAGEEQDVLVRASSDFYHMAIAGSLAAGLAAVSPAIAVSHIGIRTEAFIGREAEVHAADDVMVQARSEQKIVLVGIAVAGGLVGIAGASSVLAFEDFTYAYLGGGAEVTAGGNVSVLADDDSQVTTVTGALAVGFVGAGASVGVVTMDKDTQAVIGAQPVIVDGEVEFDGSGARVTALGQGDSVTGIYDGQVDDDEVFTATGARGVIVQANTTESLLHIVAVASGGFVAVSGAIALTSIDSDTAATIHDRSRISTYGDGVPTSGSVYVNAANQTDVDVYTIGAAAGAVAVAGAVDVGRVRNDVTAKIGDNASVLSRNDVEVNALQHQNLDSLVFSGAGGLAALAAGVSVWSVGTPLDGSIPDDEDESGSRESDVLDVKPQDDAAQTSQNGRDALLRPVDTEREGDAEAPTRSNSGLEDFRRNTRISEMDPGDEHDNSEEVAMIANVAALRIRSQVPDKIAIIADLHADETPRGARAIIGADAIVEAVDDIHIHAQSIARVEVNVGGVAVGLVGIGGSFAIINMATNAQVDIAGRLNAGDDLSISARQTDDAQTFTRGYGGGGFAITGSRSNVDMTGATTITLGDDSRLAASSIALDAEHVYRPRAYIENVVIAGIAGVGAKASRTLSGGSVIDIQPGSELHAEQMRLQTHNEVDKQSLEDDYDLRSDVGGGGAFALLSSETLIGSEEFPLVSNVQIGDGAELLVESKPAASIGADTTSPFSRILEPDFLFGREERLSIEPATLEILATSNLDVTDRATADTIGLGESTQVVSNVIANTQGRIHASGATLSNASGDVTLVTDSDSQLTAEADVQIISAASIFSLAKSTSLHNATNTIEVEDSSIRGEDLQLFAGRGRDRLTSNLNTLAAADTAGLSLVPLAQIPRAESKIAELNLVSIQGSSRLLGFEDVRLVADESERSAAGQRTSARGEFTLPPRIHPAFRIKEDAVATKVSIADTAEIVAGAVSEAVVHVLPLSQLAELPGSPNIGDRLTREQKESYGLSPDLDYELSQIVPQLRNLQIANGAIIRVDAGQAAGGTAGNFYQFIAPDGAELVEVVLSEEDYSDAARWRDLGADEPSDALVVGSGDRQAILSLLEEFFVVKPVDAGDVTASLEDAANLLLAQRRQLLEWIDSYAGDLETVIRYSDQLDEVERRLMELGVGELTSLDESTEATPLYPSGLNILLLKLPKLSASPGSVFIDSPNQPSADFGSLLGGALMAHSGATIDVNNQSPFTLVVDDLNLDDNVRLFLVDGELQAFKPGNIYHNKIALTDLEASALGTINVQQQTLLDGRLSDLGFPNLPQDMYIVGSIINDEGDICIVNNEGSIHVSGEIRGGGDGTAEVKIRANGDFSLNTDFLHHVGSDPRTLLNHGDFTEMARFLNPKHELGTGPAITEPAGPTREEWSDLSFIGPLPGELPDDPADDVILDLQTAIDSDTSSLVANGRISITARYLNVNGLLQSGVDTIQMTITPKFDANLARGGLVQGQEFVPGITSTNPVGSKFISGYFDETSQTIVLDDILARAGSINIAGQILSTGNGRLVVANGYASVDIDNETEYPLEVGEIDVSTDRRGTITITDTTVPVRYEYELSDGGISRQQFDFSFEGGLSSMPVGTPSVLSNPTTYEVVDLGTAQRPFYSWSLGTETNSETTSVYEQRSFARIDGLGRDRTTPTFQDAELTSDVPLLYPETIDTHSGLGLTEVDTRLFGSFRQTINDTVQLIRGETLVLYAESQDSEDGTWYVFIGETSAGEVNLQAEDFADLARWQRLVSDVVEARDEVVYTEVIGPRGSVADPQRDIAGYTKNVRRESVGWGARRRVITKIVQSLSTANYYTFALAADNPIAIEFLRGSDSPTVSLNSAGGLRLAGALTVPEDIGNIELESSLGSILQSETSGIFGDVPEVLALQGDVDLNLEGVSASSLEPDTVLNVRAGGDIDLRSFALSLSRPGAIQIGQVISTNGSVVIYGPDGIMANGEDSLIQGQHVQLFSSRGAIGTGKFPLRIDTQRVSGGGLSAYAEGDVRLVEIASASSGGGPLEDEISGDLLLVLPTLLPASLDVQAAVASVSGTVSLTAEAGDILDGQQELFHARRVLSGDDLSLAQRNAIATLDADDKLRFRETDFIFPVSPGLYSHVLPNASFPGDERPASFAEEQPNVIGKQVRLSTRRIDAGRPGGSIGQITAPEVIEYPFAPETNDGLKESSLYPLSRADAEDVVGVQYELLRYLGDEETINLKEAELHDPAKWAVIDPDYRTARAASEHAVDISPGQLVAVDYDRHEYGLYRYLGSPQTLRLTEQIYAESTVWEPVVADAKVSDGEARVQSGDWILNDSLIRSITIQLIDDVDVLAGEQLAADASGNITIASSADLPIEFTTGLGDVHLSSQESLIDLGDEKLGVTAIGNLTLVAGGDIRAADDSHFSIRVPNEPVTIEAEGDALVLQRLDDITLGTTTYTIRDLQVQRATAGGKLMIDNQGGDLRVQRAYSDDSVLLSALEDILDGYTVPHPSVANVATDASMPSGIRNVTLRADGGIGDPAFALLVDLPEGELDAMAEDSVRLSSSDDLLARRIESLDGDIEVDIAGELAVGRMETGRNIKITALGNVVDANDPAYFDILGHEIEIHSTDGSVGEYLNDLELDTIPGDDGQPGLVRLDGKEGVFVIEVAGSLTVRHASSTTGDVRVTVADSEAGNEDLLIPVLAGVEAQAGTVLLQAGDGLVISSVIKAGKIFINGDHRSADPEGTTVQIDGSLVADYVEITGGDDDDFFALVELNEGVTLRMLGGNDSVKGGHGDDIIDGGAGRDFIDGGPGNDRLMAGSGIGDNLLGGPGDDVLIGSDDGVDRDPDFGDAELFGDRLDGGDGDDRIAGLGGADRIIGGPGNDHIDSGQGRDSVDAGEGDDWVYPGLEDDAAMDGGTGDNTLLSAGEDLGLASQILPGSPTEGGRWTQINGSASDLGLSGNAKPEAIAFSSQPSLAISDHARFLAWTDTRSGRSHVYVAAYMGDHWVAIGDNTFGGGVSDPLKHSSSPSLMVSDEGVPTMAWVQRSEIGSDIMVARYDRASKTWKPLGDSLGELGVSMTKQASDPVLVQHELGPVLAWIDASDGEPQIRVRYFDGDQWLPLGDSESGLPSDDIGGISLSEDGAAIQDMQLVSDGQQLAVVWSQLDRFGQRHIYLREFDGSDWKGIYDSASSGGLSASLGQTQAERQHHQSPTAAFAESQLFVAWQSFSDGGSQVQAAVYKADSGGWQPPLPLDAWAASEREAQPRLVTRNEETNLIWMRDEHTIFVTEFNGEQFVEAVGGDAKQPGIRSTDSRIGSVAVAANPFGEPTVAWIDSQSIRDSVFLVAERLEPSWTNGSNPFDVNGDGFVTPLDALILINELNMNGSRALPLRAEEPSESLDVNGDGYITPLDALLVINELDE